MAEKKRYDVWTYASANSVTVPGDMTGTYWPGMKVVLKQGTLKYFMIDSVVYSTPNTTITFNGFGIYSLTSDPITAHIDTLETYPKGFPESVSTSNVAGFCPALDNDITKFLRSDGSWTTIDHGIAVGLSDDDHTGYAKLAGRSGGQSLIGGTASGDDLTIQSTSHGTKGDIILGTSKYDEVNNRLGIGRTPTTYPLEIEGNIYNTGSIITTGKLSMRPFIEIGKIAQNSKPTIIQRGASAGYSLPIYNSDNEELFISEYIAGRWNGASNITLSIIGYLDTAEDVGDDFALQISWVNKSTTSGILPATTTDVEVRTNIDTDRNAQYSIYKVDFAIDWDLNDPDIIASDYFAARIRRIAVGGSYTEMTGEFVITMIIITYNVDKVFKSV